MNSKPQSVKPIGFLPFFLIGGFILLLIKCLSSTGNNNSSAIYNDTISSNKADTTNHSPIIRKPKIAYTIVYNDLNTEGNTNSLFVYTRALDSLKSLNKYLVSRYKSENAFAFQIYYFDSKYVAKNYVDFLKDPNISDRKLDQISQHVIAKYEYSSGDVDSLKIGKGSDDF